MSSVNNWPPIVAEETALLIIDVVRDFCAPGGYADQGGMSIENLRRPIEPIVKLREAARRQGVLVVYTREGHRPDLSDLSAAKSRRAIRTGAPIGTEGPMGRLLIRGEYGHDMVDELQPEPGEPVIDKPGYGAFYQTDLDIILRNAGIRTLIFTGVTTNVCVQSTLREAIDRGYECITMEDCCATSEMALHDATMDMIRDEGDIFGRVMSSTALIERLQGSA